ncbi:MAG TPA: Crp/Fnr family transcriptional regulator [Rhizomicrobium sp.]|jgi:CRP-like cAMP-binding protein|nr:Crp/Fnr family transcriptional regulator [Rhizomicrobium sp.]
MPHLNRLLAAASPHDLAHLEAHLERVSMKARQVMEAPGKVVDYVYFPETCVASALALTGQDQRIEIALVGCEGMSGTTLVLGDDRSPHSVYVQIPGEALRMEGKVFLKLLNDKPELRCYLLKFAQVFMVQAAQTAVANGKAKLTERMARWILMAHDRTVSDDVPLTHEFLALMLGVRRASVTVAMNDFEKAGLVAVRRGEITVVNRKGIEKVAGSFYGVPEAEYRRLIHYDTRAG